jgi:hypothetical protein
LGSRVSDLFGRIWSDLPWLLLVVVFQRILSLLEKLGATISINMPASSSFYLAHPSCYRRKLDLLPLVELRWWEIKSRLRGYGSLVNKLEDLLFYEVVGRGWAP